ncbi:MAG: hypothetical protein P8Z38_07340 [Robiginitalea sp.]
MKRTTFIGGSPLKFEEAPTEGDLVTLEGEVFYKITHSEQMRPFFMSLVSDSNHWMFLSSNGALTAGRKNSEYALFPYYTDDKITESLEVTGSKTVFRIHKGNKELLWEPFSNRYEGLYRIRRNLYKNTYGNKVLFEEENLDLDLVFAYQWNTSNRFGFVKKASLTSRGGEPVSVRLLDGLQNLMPCGVTTELQNTRSNLVDAYKKSELVPGVGLGIYALSAIIVDRAEPSEALKANTVWSSGLDKPIYLLSSTQLETFREGENLRQETVVKGEKGAYFVASDLQLTAGEKRSWMLVANVNQGPSDIPNLAKMLERPGDLVEEVLKDIASGTRRLIQLTAAADGLQCSGDALRTSRHYANVMYNIMRGGIIDRDYVLEKADFIPYVRNGSRQVFQRQQAWLEKLPDTFSLFDLLGWAGGKADADLKRLCFEYLPLKFSRRHGDPSRPWNKFSINTQRETDGSKILDYQGNWRDIFQNWEALAHSYPEYIDNMIHKFLNASTADGYNPYRITKDGIDWEVVEPEDPWSFIGYWGDHQVIYLLKFLEFSEDYFPGRLLHYWDEELFVYANVPYRIRPYEALLENPKDTIDFDTDLDRKLRERRTRLGADGALIWNGEEHPYRVTLLEKLLAMLLAKVSNFIPEAGIWLNTQRPEWNDANNALVGNGVSMVTLYYLNRFLKYLDQFLKTHQPGDARVSEELATFLEKVTQTLASHREVLEGPVSDRQRRQIADGLGRAAGAYREQLYSHGFSGEKKRITRDMLTEFVEVMEAFAKHTIEANRREDGLYHAYNLISIGEDQIGISYLNEMLEGQVAVLSAGYLSPEQALDVLQSLRKSALYRSDQNSYILYPDKDLPGFLEKNCIPESHVQSSVLLQKLLEDGNTQLVERDQCGQYHFNGAFNNARRLEEALEALPAPYQVLANKEKDLILNIYEAVFDHKSFTGRSGTFFAYEGLGSIYWHMVSKLALAAQENLLVAVDKGSDTDIIKGLNASYHEINAGIGVHKSPAQYGAFPTDPYSHTPAHRGAQQPGMTGQVKEDILTRKGELGVNVRKGSLRFGPFFFGKAEYLLAPKTFDFIKMNGAENPMPLPENSMAFTFCQIPVVFNQSESRFLEIHFADGSVDKKDTLDLDPALSREIFRRSGKVRHLKVGILPTDLLNS